MRLNPGCVTLRHINLSTIRIGYVLGFKKGCLSSRVLNPVFKKLAAFTLAELLIALVILGLVATFTIPKLLTVVGNNQNKAVLKEAYSTLSHLIATGINNGAIKTTASNDGAYILNNINYVKRCPTNATTEGCINGLASGIVASGFGNESLRPAVVLSNGAVIYGLDNSSSNWWGMNFIVIDANGTDLPNTLGQDALFLVACYKGPPTGGCTTGYSPIIGKPGMLLPAWHGAIVTTSQDGANNLALYQSLFN
jgi:prepilin-type N-terminal cleavage/methylation domain-containing protein